MTESLVSRRAFVRGGIAGATLLAIGSGLGLWTNVGYAAQLGPLDVPIALSVKEFAVIRALVDALLPGEDGFPAGLVLGIHQRIDEEVWSVGETLRSDVKSGIQLLEHIPPLYGHLHRFTALSRAARTSVFEAMSSSSIGAVRQLAISLKELHQILYYGHEAVWPHIGYDGVFVSTPRPPDSSLAYAALLRERRRG